MSGREGRRSTRQDIKTSSHRQAITLSESFQHLDTMEWIFDLEIVVLYLTVKIIDMYIGSDDLVLRTDG